MATLISKMSRDALSRVISGITMVILATAAYAVFMFWISVSNYESAVNITTGVENRLLNIQSVFNRQARYWSNLEFDRMGRSKQASVWSAFVDAQAEVQNAAIASYSEMNSSSAARPYISKFLALYGDITKQYLYQKKTLEIGDPIGPSSQKKTNDLIRQANLQLDRGVRVLHGEIASMTSNTATFIDNGSMASVISFSLTLSMMIFLSAGLYFRQRIL